MNILITGVGGPTVRSITKSIRMSDKLGQLSIIGVDANPYCHGLYEKGMYDASYTVPKAHESNYWRSIKDIVEKHSIDIAIVQPEKEVIGWSKYRQEGNHYPCKVFLSNADLNAVLVNKSIMTDHLKDMDLVPRSLTFSPKTVESKNVGEVIGYPYWVRGVIGSSGLGSLKVSSSDELENWLSINPSIEQFIASTFLPGRNLACKMLYYQGELVRAACGERVNYIMSNVAPSGITGNTSFGRLINEPELVEKSKRALEYLFEVTGAEKHGFFTADFKEDENGTAYLPEINARMVAFNLSFAKAGANFAEDIIRLVQEDPTFNRSFKMYEFEPGTVFLRDVDAEPILMNEGDIL